VIAHFLLTVRNTRAKPNIHHAGIKREGRVTHLAMAGRQSLSCRLAVATPRSLSRHEQSPARIWPDESTRGQPTQLIRLLTRPG
jgi:hypothetical protein